MPRKSNKTSYVMNLITSGENGEEEQQGQESQGVQSAQTSQEGQSALNAQNIQNSQTAQNMPAAQTSAPGVSPEAEMKKVVVVDEDQESERLSEEIRDQLELQLEAELKEQAGPAAEPEQLSQEAGRPSQMTEAVKQEPTETVTADPAAEAAASADMETIKTEIAEPTMDTEMNTAADATVAAENMNVDTAAATEHMNTTAATTETANTTTQPTQPAQSGYRMVNVMETLVARVDLDKYMKEYGVCPCPRCRADVHALILTSLPSKYVVMDENAISLMLNFYESRRKTDIFTATLKACLEVKEHPRHEGAEGQ